MRVGFLLSGLPLAALLVAALRAGPAVRDGWNLVGVDANLTVLYARVSVSNTEFLDGQATTRLALLAPGSPVIQHRALSGPTQVRPDGVRTASDALEQTVDGWELRVGGGELGGRVHARGATADCPPAIGAMTGFVGSETEGEMLAGAAVISHTRDVGAVSGEALYVVGPGFAAGIDPLSDCPAWVRAGARAWTGDAPPVRDTVVLGDWTLRSRRAGDPVLLDDFAHLLPPERWLAALWGFGAPRVIVRRVVVDVEGPGIAAARGGLLLARE